MAAETVTISKKEYNKLKKMAEVNTEVVEDFKKSLEDLRKGRIRVRA